MIQALPKTKSVTFEEFVQWKPEGKYYELHHGVIIEMNQPLGDHEWIIIFLNRKINSESERLGLSYGIAKTVLVKPPDNESGYSPDVLLLNPSNLINEPLWKKQSTVTQGASIPLVIEVVSTNWRVDYLSKVKDYEEIGIPEYWIVDYLALGGTPYIGNPKQPTISIYDLINGEYQVSQFRENQTIVSRTFPELTLTANQIFQAGI
ncbi:Uma2 family endonuclease [Aphanizomenon flos-aquae NRERC-008]|jgi:Uma2 family endonuclease|uniref:Uma2 family endonuclease n=1 Tax=Aphanizomenon flos-aquae FACHB-1249 TaxID=2692889 RepID=A0ABR8IS00_APHFL|nr:MULTISPECIES: Uma2 family endonuclease [Aphanizomenon]MCE2903628.1 Uma2 family endonuclease [Anabaena sp. CoA2_C59]MDJ0504922.1 Uma2 family endonuclease [Nostocales cyanobacterium LE14-WE12]MBD2390630.1 Uma2 family endonuclease [Aphanizomenon flos-aquae FACHB-1171]MBD2557605.1 Uma2 family endonuclease [Aphanizomenon flos-aquae FACHB-1290]MBD2632042.1 Uma2 family endonuclease [Aphanizomenon sp. FACHB-1399]